MVNSFEVSLVLAFFPTNKTRTLPNLLSRLPLPNHHPPLMTMERETAVLNSGIFYFLIEHQPASLHSSVFYLDDHGKKIQILY